MEALIPFIILGGGGFLFILVLFTTFIPIPLWLEARTCGADVGLIDFLFFRFRGINPTTLVKPLIMGTKADLGVELKRLETHHLAGGDVQRVVDALISASSAKLPLDFNTAAAIDRAGRDVLQAVRMCVTPKVIMTGMVENMAKDGIQVKAKAQITVKANIHRLVGGAGEETILARVGEGICTRIGSCTSHKEVLENPDSISEYVLSKGLDKNTAFEILSIDIADVDVGENIGAKLQIDQADADKRIAEAKAAQRVANARAEREEMYAREQESKAKLIDAQAKIPMALAEALLSGKLAVMDYHRLKNIEADTQMRQSIAHLGPELELSSQDK
ncbi:MAG: flotillin-like protein FloA [Candidatus Cloacimonetes bacterium]|nr:flotillin-like protein FloA [Candidatus Cloacimonadota bacterium]